MKILIYQESITVDPKKISLPENSFSLVNYKKVILQAALDKFNGNKTKAANFLDISRYVLHRRLQEKDIPKQCKNAHMSDNERVKSLICKEDFLQK